MEKATDGGEVPREVVIGQLEICHHLSLRDLKRDVLAELVARQLQGAEGSVALHVGQGASESIVLCHYFAINMYVHNNQQQAAEIPEVNTSPYVHADKVYVGLQADMLYGHVCHVVISHSRQWRKGRHLSPAQRKRIG